MKNYKIAVAGTGYVGLSIATLLSQHHQVTAVDIVPEKVELINNRKSPIQDDYIEKYLAEKELNLTATLDAKAALKRHPEFAKNDAIRMKSFKKFKDEHFTKLSPIFKGYEALCSGATRYSAVVTGSDQLWSPAGLPTNYYNLQFVPDSIRKISYASSFGVKEIPWYQKKRTTAFLNRIEFISMRENRGSEIVKELIGRDVPVILDPVFMFDSEGWKKLIPEKKEIDEPYIFAYFLGNTAEYRTAVNKAAKELRCKVVALRHLDQYVPEDENFGDVALYDVGPDRFLNLLRGAAYICTDSFHGSCFSIIHEDIKRHCSRFMNVSLKDHIIENAKRIYYYKKFKEST